MATYGSRDKNRFAPGGNLGTTQYYTLVDEQGNITIKSPTVAGNIGGANSDRTVGTIPRGGSFELSPGSTTTQESQYFSIEANQKAVKNQAVITAQRGGATNAQQLIFPNTAPAAPQQPGQGGTPPPAPTLPGPDQTGTGQVGETQQVDIAGGRGSSGLRYPKKMKPEQDKIKFQAVRILPRVPSSGTGLKFEFGKPQYEPTDGPVCLAIQAPISDQNSVDWGPDSVNAIDAAIFNASFNMMKANTGQQLTDIVTNEAKGIYSEARKYSDLMRKFLAGQAASLNNVLARTDNVVLNPNLELLFQGPQLRPFTFQFKMSARSQAEADEIKAIIKYFKYHMAVRKTDDNLFLRAPHVFTIRYLKGDLQNHPGINVISPNESQKACALTNCSVDYTPLGSYMTYEDGTMTAYTLSLQFQELTPIYDTDYKDYPNDIGF